MIDAVSLQTISDENLGLRAGVYPAALSRRGLALLTGPQGHLYSVALLVPDRIDPLVAPPGDVSRQYLLFVLGIKCLRLALATTLAQARIFLRARLRRR
jgi:hypothetical protein